MMNNKDREFNSTDMNVHIYHGIPMSDGQKLLEKRLDGDLFVFENRLKRQDLVSLYALETILKFELSHIRLLEHVTLRDYYGIPSMELFRQAYVNHQEMFRAYKNNLRTKIKLVQIYKHRLWNDMERSANE